MKKRPIAEVAEEILLNKGSPLHYREITRLIFDYCDLSGKTPHETVRSRLATSPKFKRVAEGVFGLAIWPHYPAIRFAKDIAYDILKKRGKPMNIKLLGEEIQKERKFKNPPMQVARGIVRNDKRFYLNDKLDMAGLLEWRKK